MIHPQPYPWSAIEHIPKASLELLRVVREALRGSVDLSKAGAFAGDILGEPVELIVTRTRPWRESFGPSRGASCLLRCPDDAATVLVQIDSMFAARICSMIIRQRCPWVDETSAAPPAMQAAVGAFFAATARRAVVRSAYASAPLHVAAVGERAIHAFRSLATPSAVSVHATALLDQEAFSVSAHAVATHPPSSGLQPFALGDLRRLGDAPLSLRVIAAASTALPATLLGLRPGDAWMPTGGWTVARVGHGLEGAVLLAVPGGELALSANLHGDGRIVLGNGVMHADADVDDAGLNANARSASSENFTVADVMADAPVVVRVELGAVTMRAREWAALRPGDVVMTGKRVAERVALRVGGIELACGELVDVDGELGVRVHALTGEVCVR